MTEKRRMLIMRRFFNMNTEVRDLDFEQLKEKAHDLPRKPGVYIMKDKDGTIIYVGKAKALKNRKGTAAADFSYITENGETGTLHGIHAKHTILYFFNPDCHDCARVSEIIGNDSTIREMVGSKQLSVLALYPDKDMTAWNKHFGKWPKEWITARYADLAEKEKYDLPAIPNIYLLDENKTVVLKDAAIEEIIDHLNSRTK